jgi:hypothetical protein
MVGANGGGSWSDSLVGIDIPFRLILGGPVLSSDSYLMELGKKRQRFLKSVQDRDAILPGFRLRPIGDAECDCRCPSKQSF